MKATAILAITFVAAGVAAALPTSVNLSPKDRADLLQAAAAVRTAILNGDAAALLALVSPTQGLGCTDDTYKYQEVARYLRDKGSYLYIALFDTSQFQAECGDGYPPEGLPISDKEFFERSANIFTKITMAEKGTAEVTYATSESGLDHRQYYFHKESHGWRLVGGLIIGECTCG